MTGLMARGMTANALKEHIMMMSDLHNDTVIRWDDVWYDNRRVLDLTAPRYWAIADPATR